MKEFDPNIHNLVPLITVSSKLKALENENNDVKTGYQKLATIYLNTKKQFENEAKIFETEILKSRTTEKELKKLCDLKERIEAENKIAQKGQETH